MIIIRHDQTEVLPVMPRFTLAGKGWAKLVLLSMLLRTFGRLYVAIMLVLRKNQINLDSYKAN